MLTDSILLSLNNSPPTSNPSSSSATVYQPRRLPQPPPPLASALPNGRSQPKPSPLNPDLFPKSSSTSQGINRPEPLDPNLLPQSSSFPTLSPLILLLPSAFSSPQHPIPSSTEDAIPDCGENRLPFFTQLVQNQTLPTSDSQSSVVTLDSEASHSFPPQLLLLDSSPTSPHRQSVVFSSSQNFDSDTSPSLLPSPPPLTQQHPYNQIFNPQGAFPSPEPLALQLSKSYGKEVFSPVLPKPAIQRDPLLFLELEATQKTLKQALNENSSLKEELIKCDESINVAYRRLSEKALEIEQLKDQKKELQSRIATLQTYINVKESKSPENYRGDVCKKPIIARRNSL